MKKIVTVLFMGLVLTACQKFLDVNPKGEVFDADMFTTAEGYEDALYGIYNELSETQSLFGAYYWWIPEACSQNVIAGASSSDYQFGYIQLGYWYDTAQKSICKSLWSDGYKAINHVNNIIQHAEDGGVESFRHGNLYLGEAYALRAFLHFELLKLFGAPYWASDEVKKQAIPYVEKYSFDVTPFSSFDEVVEKILADFSKAEVLLSEDSELVTVERDNAATGFTSARITHLNLYAVQALMARLYWYRGDMTNAAIYAQKVIDSKKFSFRPLSAFRQPDNGTLDLNETLFGLYGLKYQTWNAQKYGLTGTVSRAFLLPTDWNTLYEQDALSVTTVDYRLTAWFNDGDQTLRKLANSVYYEGTGNTYGGPSILGANVIRLPELYYIMAEAYMETNPSIAVDYYNEVLATRGRPSVAESALTQAALFKERRREVYGEGFTWYEMKRGKMDVPTIRGDVLRGDLPSTFMVPIPDEEYAARDNMEI